MSFSDKIKAQEEEAQKEGFAGGNDWYKFTEGANMFRVLAEPEMIYEKYKVGICYTDCGYEGSPKFLTYIIDRKDNRIKLAKLPYGVGSTIASYQTDVEFGNDFTDFPMPYDVRVTAKGAGSKEVEYKTDPSPKRIEIESHILEALSKKKPISEIVQKMKDNQKEKHVADGTWQAEQDRKTKLHSELQPLRDAERAGRNTEPDITLEDIGF